jgi:polysaccharide export outer membrane protein
MPAEYTIGAADVLSIIFWRDKELTADVNVRPDGKISLPLLNDVQATGLTPAQLRERIVEESKKYVEDPNVTVVVKQINSRKVFITG